MNAMPDKTLPPAESPAYATMEKALYLLADQHISPASLGELAAACGLSEFHFQKLFSRWVGISPKRFCQYLDKEYIKNLLDAGLTPLGACYQTGLSGPGRLHDLFITTEAVTPAQYHKQGCDLTIEYGIHQSPFGAYLVAVTSQGICHMAFITGSPDAAINQLQRLWPLSHLRREEGFTLKTHNRLFNGRPDGDRPVSILLKGTNFQIQVWLALLRIPYGQVTSYEQLAHLAGNPDATRACASAIAANQIAWLIPCHRVIRKLGETGQYRWGSTRKRLILGYEAATRSD